MLVECICSHGHCLAGICHLNGANAIGNYGSVVLEHNRRGAVLYGLLDVGTAVVSATVHGHEQAAGRYAAGVAHHIGNVDVCAARAREHAAILYDLGQCH